MTEMEQFLTAQINQLTAQNQQLLNEVQLLREQIAVMNQRMFGRKSEKFVDPNQMGLFDDQPLSFAEQAMLEQIEAKQAQRKVPGQKRQK